MVLETICNNLCMTIVRHLSGLSFSSKFHSLQQLSNPEKYNAQIIKLKRNDRDDVHTSSQLATVKCSLQSG